MPHGIPLLCRSKPAGHGHHSLHPSFFNSLPPQWRSSSFLRTLSRSFLGSTRIWIGLSVGSLHVSRLSSLFISLHRLDLFLLLKLSPQLTLNLLLTSFLSLFLSSSSVCQGWCALKGWWSQGLIAVEATGSLSSQLTGSDPSLKIFSLSTDFFSLLVLTTSVTDWGSN